MVHSASTGPGDETEQQELRVGFEALAVVDLTAGEGDQVGKLGRAVDASSMTGSTVSSSTVCMVSRCMRGGREGGAATDAGIGPTVLQSVVHTYYRR